MDLVQRIRALMPSAVTPEIITHTVMVLPFGAAATAGTDLGETLVAVAPHSCAVVGVQFIASAGVTAHASNYAEFSLENGAGVDIATRSTILASGNVVANAAETLVPEAQYAVLAKGDTLWVDVRKVASGVATPSGFFVVSLEPRD